MSRTRVVSTRLLLRLSQRRGQTVGDVAILAWTAVLALPPVEPSSGQKVGGPSSVSGLRREEPADQGIESGLERSMEVRLQCQSRRRDAIDRHSALFPRLGRSSFDANCSCSDRLHERVAPYEEQNRVGGLGQLDASQAGSEEFNGDDLPGRSENLRDRTALVSNRYEFTVCLNCVDERPGDRTNALTRSLSPRFEFDDRCLHAFDESVQESFFVADVPIDRRHGDAEFLAQGTHRQSSEAIHLDDRDCSIDHPLACQPIAHPGTLPWGLPPGL
jgi:hypothetical protein